MIRNTPHRATITVATPTDDDGYGSPAYEWVEGPTVPAVFGVLDADELNVFDGGTGTVDASVRVPTGTAVSNRDRVTIAGPGAPSGAFEITAVRPNRDHVRLMLKTVTAG